MRNKVIMLLLFSVFAFGEDKPKQLKSETKLALREAQAQSMANQIRMVELQNEFTKRQNNLKNLEDAVVKAVEEANKECGKDYIVNQSTLTCEVAPKKDETKKEEKK